MASLGSEAAAQPLNPFATSWGVAFWALDGWDKFIPMFTFHGKSWKIPVKWMMKWKGDEIVSHIF